MKLLFTLVCTFSLMMNLHAQLADGAEAPDFTVEDINGNSYSLYAMMGSNKAACLDFMATWCGPCWSFKNSGVLEQVYNNLGSQTTVIMLEADFSTNTNCLYGSTGCNSTTQGNWVAGTPYPIADLSTSNGPSVPSDYSISFYPTLYVISPDKRAWSIKSRTYFEYENWITKSFKLNANGAVTHSTCGDNGKVTLAITGGFGVITYEWSNGATTKDISNLPGGSYSVRVKDQYGYFKDFGPFVVQGPSKRVAITSSQLTHINCYGESTGSIELQLDHGTPPYQFNWSNGKKTQDILNLPAGPYAVTVTDNNNCTTTKSYTLTQSALMKLTTIGKAETCDQKNGSILAKATGGVPPYEFDLGNGKQVNPFFDNLAGGQSYSVTATDSKGCDEISNVFVDITHKPAASAGGDKDISCIAPQIQLDGSMSEDGTQIIYEWTTIKGRILSGSDEKFPTVDLPGIYKLKVRNIINSCEAFDSVEVFDGRVFPDIHTTGDTNINCKNTRAVITGISKDSSVQVYWKKAGDSTFWQLGYKLETEDAGQYAFFVLDTLTKCLITDTVKLIKNQEKPVAHATPERTLSCTVPEVIIDGSNSSQGLEFSYSWSTQSGRIVSGAQSLYPVVDQKGVYKLEVKNAINHCSNSTDAIVYQQDVPVSAFNESVNGRQVNFNDLSSGLPLQWNWSFGDGQSSKQQNPSHLYAQDGEFEVCLEITNECGVHNNCHKILVGINAALNLTNWELRNASCFGGTDGLIKIEVNGGVPPYQYLWSNGSKDKDILNLIAGSYSVEIKDQQGTILKQSFTVKEPLEIKLQDVTIQHSKPGLTEGQIQLDVTGGVPPFLYKWSNGGDVNPLINLAPGVYQCVVKDAHQCEKVFGPFEVKEIVSNSDLNEIQKLQVVPNPGTHSELRFELADVAEVQIKIYDCIGSLTAMKSMRANKGKIQLAEWVGPSGLYWIVVETSKSREMIQWIKP